MKIKLLLMLAVVALFFALPREVRASSCTAARLHNWQDMGCNQCYAGAGGVPKAKCPDCPGMPRWWVHEPYENLCMSDTPLSYSMSFGQEMTFQFFYHQRYQLPFPDELPDFYMTGNSYTPHFASDPYLLHAHTPGMTNASWAHNGMKDICFWDTQWESLVANGQPHLLPFSYGYEALVFKPEGGIQYFYSTNNNTQTYLKDSQSQVQIMPSSTLGRPTVNTPVADANGVYWGDTQTNGFQLIYPDGSKEFYGFCYYPTGLKTNPLGANSGARAFLTQQIDPQGRAIQFGYEPETNTATHSYRVRYVVDRDGKTNTFQYSFGFQLTEIDDPYGRKTMLGYNSLGMLTNITDAATNSSSFTYQGTNGWITKLTTPYGNTSFNYFEVPDSSAPDAFQKRAVYVSEPTGAQQLYYYLHNGSGLMSATATAPTVPGQTNFDDGNLTGNHPTLDYRNTIYWGRRQCGALSSNTLTFLSSNLGQALTNLTANDFRKGLTRNWLWQPDNISISESLSSEREPSPDAAGQIEDTYRTWYNYAYKSAPETLGNYPQVTCIARLLPDNTSQYTTYNYYYGVYVYGGGLVSENESTYSKPDGNVGVLTNLFRYAYGGIDLISVSNSAGQYVNLGYNGIHQIISATNALNQVTTLSWNPKLTGIQWPSGQSVSLGYFFGGYRDTNDIFIPDPNNGFLQTVSWYPSGRSFTINSNYAGLPANVTDDRGVTVANTWDGLNRLTGTSFPDTTTISNIYYRLDLVGTKDRLGNWTRYAFDGLQHLTTVTNANNAVTSYSWCGCGSLESIVDALTNLTTLNYDNQGNLTNVVFPDYSSLTWQFDFAGRMTNAFDGAGRSLRLAYNNQGLATNVASANGTLRQTIYDALNRPVSVTDANGVTVTNSFDALNEMLKCTWPDGISEGYGYTAAGLVAYTNRDQKVTRYGRDGAGRLTSVTNANTEVTQLGYDSLNNLTSLIDGLLHQTTWQYNQYGWLTNKVDGLTRNVERFSFNPNGWLTNRWTPEKGNTGYSYDNVGNLKSIVYPQQTINYAYDALNQLTNMVDGVGTTAFSYTPAGRLQSENGPWANDTLTSTYVQGLRTALTLSQTSSNWSESFGYDSGWRLQTLTSPAGSFTYSYNFQPASSLVTGIQLPNGANIVNSYDSLARLTGTALNDHWGHTLDGYTYTPDALGLRTNIVRNLGLTSSTVTAGFDNIGQLTSWNATETTGGMPRQNEQLGFGYDAAHNLHTRNNGALAQTFTTDAANQLNSVSRTGTFTMSGATPAPATSVTVNGLAAQTYGDFTFAATNLTLANGANNFMVIAQNAYGLRVTNSMTLNLPQSVTLGFDNNGNLTNDGVKSLSYDSENQLTNVTLVGSWKSEFIYDGLNRRRISRDYNWNGGSWIKTNEVHYIYDGGLLVQERDSNNVPLVGKHP